MTTPFIQADGRRPAKNLPRRGAESAAVVRPGPENLTDAQGGDS